MVKGERRRYIAVKLGRQHPFPREDFMEAVRGSLYRLYGLYGASHTKLYLVEYSPEKGYAILRCHHKALDHLMSSLAFITKIGDAQASFRVLAISGTLRALRKRLGCFLKEG